MKSRSANRGRRSPRYQKKRPRFECFSQIGPDLDRQGIWPDKMTGVRIHFSIANHSVSRFEARPLAFWLKDDVNHGNIDHWSDQDNALSAEATMSDAGHHPRASRTSA